MKRIVLLILFSFAFLCIKAENYITTHNKDITANIHFGTVSDFGQSAFLIGGSFSIYGVYVDFSAASPKHRHSVEVDRWNDEVSCTVVHIGYQFPVYKNLKLTPLIGSYKFQLGTTNGWDWSVTSYGLINNFTVEETITRFDYGIQASLYYPCGINLSATYTINTWYVGIGYIVFL